MSFKAIQNEIINHPSNAELTAKDWKPIYTASKTSKIVIIGQAPGIKAQESEVPWNDSSGDKLIEWLGINEETFSNPEVISLLPMDFYYPGKGKTGDLPPRKDFADLWHKKILDLMPEVELTILIGQYSQKYYLGKDMQRNLTETVRNYENYLPKYMPIVHPSPLNFRWQAKNTWFKSDVLPELQKRARQILA